MQKHKYFDKSIMCVCTAKYYLIHVNLKITTGTDFNFTKVICHFLKNMSQTKQRK